MYKKSILLLPLLGAFSCEAALASFPDDIDYDQQILAYQQIEARVRGQGIRDEYAGKSEEDQIAILQAMGAFDNDVAKPQNKRPSPDAVLSPEELAFLNSNNLTPEEELFVNNNNLTPEEEVFVNQKDDQVIALSEEEQLMILQAEEAEDAPANNNAGNRRVPSPEVQTRFQQDSEYEATQRQDQINERKTQLNAQIAEGTARMAPMAEQLVQLKAAKQALEDERDNHRDRLMKLGGLNPRIEAQVNVLTKQIADVQAQITPVEAEQKKIQDQLDAVIAQLVALED